MEKIFLNIKSQQGKIGEEADRLEFFTEGVKSCENGKLKLSYIETEVLGFPGHTTDITVDSDRIVMERKGEFSSRFEFRPGEQFAGSYKTPYGSIRLSVLPIRAQFSPDERGGEIELIYEMSVEDERYLNRYILNYRNSDKGGDKKC